jgi:hypothetical protein
VPKTLRRRRTSRCQRAAGSRLKMRRSHEAFPRIRIARHGWAEARAPAPFGGRSRGVVCRAADVSRTGERRLDDARTVRTVSCSVRASHGSSPRDANATRYRRSDLYLMRWSRHGHGWCALQQVENPSLPRNQAQDRSLAHGESLSSGERSARAREAGDTGAGAGARALASSQVAAAGERESSERSESLRTDRC